MSRIKLISDLLSHYKYAITIIIGVLLVGFVDDNSFRRRVELEMQINDLNEEIAKYNEQNEHDMRQLKELGKGVRAYEKIAREKYFMQADNEDIYVLSDDPKPNKKEKDETTE